MVKTLFGILQNMPKMRTVVVSDSGSPVKDKFIMEVTSKGYPNLRKIGEHNVYNEIQSYREGCDLSAILQSFSGQCPRFDPLDFDAAEEFVNDFSNVSSLGDLVNDGESVKQFFSELPVEVRDSYDNSVHKFARDFNSDGFINHLWEAFGKPNKTVLAETDSPPSEPDSNSVSVDSDSSTD